MHAVIRRIRLLGRLLGNYVCEMFEPATVIRHEAKLAT